MRMTSRNVLPQSIRTQRGVWPRGVPRLRLIRAHDTLLRLSLVQGVSRVMNRSF